MKKIQFGMAALVAAAICVATAPSPSFADAVTDTNEVTAVVAGWQSAREALGDQLTASPASVKAYSGLGGTGTYYVVTLEGGGFVVTSGDTALEPVLAYSKTGEWVDDVTRNPLMAMIQIDVAAASAACETTSVQQQGGGRRLAASSGGAQSSATAAKWAKYKAAASGGAQSAGGKRLMATAPSSDLRISPLVQSSWNQEGHGENYYTPGNFVCGCTATMCAQLMRYWKWPTASVTANADYKGSVTYISTDKTQTNSTTWTVNSGYYKATKNSWTGRWTVDSKPTAWSPAFGGTYDWANMPLSPTSVKTAIGKLTRDCGIVSMMGYAEGGSGAAITLFAHRAVDQFGYANGKCMNGWRDVTRDAMLASIDAGIPCGVAVYGTPGGHAIVADGYGYDSSSTLFIHFNMGWGNVGSDTWYTPPAVGSFDSVGDILYNIYPPSKSATDRTVVSGRVLNGSGSAVGGVTVTAVNRETGESFTATSASGGSVSFNGESSSTVGKGIYTFMLPAGFYSFTATSGGSAAKVEAQVKPCISAIEGNGTPGNIHGLDLWLGTAIAAPAVSLAQRWSTDQGAADLGANLLNTDAATIEIWAANNEVKSGSRIFEYGTGTDSYFMMAWTKGTDIYNDCVELVSGGTSSVNDGTLAPYTLGKQYHISVTFERQPDCSTLVRAMKRDAASGALLRDAVYTMVTGIHTFTNPRLRLGLSFQGNADANAVYDEVRVWNGALTDAQLKASVLAGPDANLSTLPWNASAVKYVAKAVWLGGTTAPTASSLASSASWSCTDQNGDAITGVPEARSVVIIPNGETAFTIPSGYTPAWRKVRFGTEGAATTRLASKNYTSSTAYANLNPAAADYTLQGDADVSSGFERRVAVPDTADVPAGLAGKQFRYDGWVNVSAGQAGRWKIVAYADDYAALRIDDEWLAFSALGDNTSCNTRTVGADVSKGWHRFTLVVSDYYGGYGGCAATTDHLTATPVLVSINGGNAVAFTSSSFAFGSPSGTSAVTLTGDCDLSAVEEVVLDAGSTLDLNGHVLQLNAVSSSYVGAALANSSETPATLVARAGGFDSDNIAVPANVTVGAAAAEGSFVWNGANGADWATPGNWLVNGSVAASAPGPSDTIHFLNAAAVTVGGSAALTVARIVTTTDKTVTFACPVAFAGTYYVDNAFVAPVFAQGATATHPDAALTDMNAASHILPDGLVFTADWIVPTQASGKPFVVPAGASVSGQKITGTEYLASQPCIRIDAGAVATFTEVPSARTFVFWLNGGRLVVTGDVLVHNGGNSRDLGYYNNGCIGTVEANGVYKSASGDGAITCYVTNFVIGAGGFGMLRRDYMWNFNRPCTLTAKADFTIHEPHAETGALDGQKDNDWGLNFQGNTFTVDTAGHTVTFDSYVRENTAKLVKEGAGEMTMRSRQKKHSGGTDVKGGKLTVAVANGAGYGTTTVYSGATLTFASAVTSQGYPIVVKNGGTLEWGAAVDGTSTLTLEAGAIVKPVAAAAFTATEVTLPSSGTVTVDLMDVPLTANTAVSILGGVSDASKFTAVVPSGVAGALSLDGTTLVYTPTAVSDVSDADYVWAGANGADWSVASNWRVNGAAPATAPTAKDTIRFENASAVTVGGTGTLNVNKVVANGSAAVTFNCPVQFRSTYKVVKVNTGSAVKFPGGATATYPDASIRTSSSTDLQRTLDGIFTFTANWSVPNLGDGSHPWRIASGSEVYGQTFTGTENGTSRILYIANGAYARFTTVAIGLNKGEIGIDGTLEATTEITLGGSATLGSGGTTGTVKAPCIRKISGNYFHCNVPNIFVGAGGIGADCKDYDFRFSCNAVITATDNFDFLGVYRAADVNDWCFNLNGKTVTINIPEGLTATLGVTVTGSGTIRKTGAGTLVMTDTDKKGQSGYVKRYTGGTVIEEGTLRVAAVQENQIGTGSVTVGANGRLEVAPGVTLANIVKTSTDGAGSIYMGDGSSIAVSADTPCRLASFEVAPGGTATITTSSSADAGAVLLSGVSADSASRLNIPSGFTLAEGVLHVQADIQDKFLEYIESTSAGKQWIDTGIVGKCDTRAEMTISWLPDGARVDGSFLSSRQKTGDFRFILCSNDSHGQYYCGHRKYWNYTGYKVPTSNPPIDRIECSITATSASATKVTMKINGTERITNTTSGTPLDTGYTMYLFAQHNGAVSSSSDPNQVDLCSVVRCYGVKIWQDDVLVREYRPCMRNGKAGLYDAVSGEFFVSQSSTDFVAGPVLKPDHFIQYVESTGTQYIDTGIVGRPNTAMQAHVLWTTVSDTYFLASRTDGGNTRFCLYGCNTTHYMAHRTYQKGRDSTESANGYTQETVHFNANAPDYISSSISHDGTTLSYWLEVNGTRRFTRTRTEAALDTGLNMYLFGCNQGGVLKLSSKIRCYDVKIWQDGVLVRDFRPCLKDGRAGLYDEVSSWIFFPQGGELNYPNETPDKSVRWANVSGSRYVPAGVFAESGVTAQMKVHPAGGAVQTLDMASGAPLGASADGLSLFLFATNTDGNPSSYFAGRFYSGKIWNPGGALVRDFKPCIKDNSIMFFDEVSQTMFRPYPAIPAVKGSYCPKGAMIIAK